MKIGDVRIRSFIHPDSINVRIWEVEQYRECTGKYAKPGQCAWMNVLFREEVEPCCCSEKEALAIAKKYDVNGCLK